MIIDAHTHFTTAPAQLQAYRGQQITNLAKPLKAKLQISDEELARSMAGQQTLSSSAARPGRSCLRSESRHRFTSPSSSG